MSTSNVHYTSNSDEWYTPSHIIDRVIAVMGGIDLDPCSYDGNPIPSDYYTKASNGLIQPWFGRVYMNPPYGRTIGQWTGRLVCAYEGGHVTEAIALVPSRTDTAWFRQLSPYPRCFLWGRLKFGGCKTSAPFPSMAVYLGSNVSGFVQSFSDIGDTYVRTQD